MMARKKSHNLSERQIKILEVLDNFQKESGYPPSIREICNETTITSTSLVNYYLDQLQEMGYIERDTHVSRGIRLVKPLTGITGAVSGTARAATSAVRQSAQNLRQAVDEVLHIPMLGRIIAGE